MSTADSLLIAISQLITAEVFYPLRPKASPREITNIGRITSFCSMSVALLISLLAGQGISDLAAVQFSISFQIVPVFLVGLFATRKTDCHPWSLAAGVWSGFLTVFLIQFVYIGEGRAKSSGIPLNSGVTGCFVNIFVCFISELCFRIYKTRKDAAAIGQEPKKKETSVSQQGTYEHVGQPGWDVPKLERFGDAPLTAELMWKAMRGVTEPLTQPWFAVLMFAMTLLMCPMVPPDQPPLDEGGMLAFPPGVVNGIPSWAFKVILMSALTTVFLLMSIRTIPDEFPKDEELAAGGETPDPNVMELTEAEMGMRFSFDASNRASMERRISASTSIRGSMLEKAMSDRDMVLRASRASIGHLAESIGLGVSTLDLVKENSKKLPKVTRSSH
mmetsp:Transcript_16621/g.47863  ORF Transcript_16621/g.47863 Transcript_16621/m.47863 type:complete len:388 (-) Transcript_16621:1184-2347(-)